MLDREYPGAVVDALLRASGVQLSLPSPMKGLTDDERLTRSGVLLWVKRDDLIHPDFPGNKWRKLAPNLVAARQQRHQRLLTFGGAYSNHLRAVAAAGLLFGFETIGVVRGEQHDPLNEVLATASRFGMHLKYIDRTTYRDKTNPRLLQQLRMEFGDCYVLPEGGSNALALQGCAELPSEIEIDFDIITCAVGTGGTLAGIAAGLGEGQQALGVAVLKGAQFLECDVAALQQEAFGRRFTNWRIDHDFHHGGYAKSTSGLRAFVDDFERRHHIRLNWLYEAKMLHAVYSRIADGSIPRGSRVVAVLAG